MNGQKIIFFYFDKEYQIYLTYPPTYLGSNQEEIVYGGKQVNQFDRFTGRRYIYGGEYKINYINFKNYKNMYVYNIQVPNLPEIK